MIVTVLDVPSVVGNVFRENAIPKSNLKCHKNMAWVQFSDEKKIGALLYH